MSETLELGPPQRLLIVRNPHSTNAAGSALRIGQLAELLQLDAEVINHRPTPADFEGIDRHTFVASDGGDGTFGNTVSAIFGIPSCEQPASTLNGRRQEIIDHITLFGLAGGYANNWAVSAHDRAAAQPAELRRLSFRDGDFQPLHGTVHNQAGSQVHNFVATSCTGVGAPGNIMLAAGAAKARLRRQPAPVRLVSEGRLSYRAALETSPFNADLTYHFAGRAALQHHALDVISLDFIKTPRYAKAGRTPVQVDDPRWQLMIVHGGGDIQQRKANVREAFSRLAFGRHNHAPLDFSKLDPERGLEIVYRGQRIAPFQVDGEVFATNPPLPFALQPDWTLTLKPLPAIRTIIAYPAAA